LASTLAFLGISQEAGESLLSRVKPRRWISQFEMATDIHPTALVESGARLGAGCVIHPFAVVKRWAILGESVAVHPFAVVGGDSQDLKFDARKESWVRVGSRTRIREGVTINRSTNPGGVTVVGDNCLLMACSHVAHDCTVGRDVVIANAVLLAGHVTVGDNAILGGASIYHQFVRVGKGVMVGGGSRISLDLPPYTLLTERNEVIGLNLVGLKRRRASREAIRELKEAFRAVYEAPGNIREITAKMLSSGRCTTAECQSFLEFFAESERGFARPRQKLNAARRIADDFRLQVDRSSDSVDTFEAELAPINVANRSLVTQ
jgi:UDP-N-acetylglucosamine acyltransferase